MMRSSDAMEPTIGKIMATMTMLSIILQIWKLYLAVIYAVTQTTAMFTNEQHTAYRNVNQSIFSM